MAQQGGMMPTLPDEGGAVPCLRRGTAWVSSEGDDACPA